MVLKPTLPYNLYKNEEFYKKYLSDSYMYLAVYFLMVMLVQFIVNSYVIANKCGGNITENMGAAGVFTFLPYTLIFGVVILILTIYPGFKSAFSDVVGYFYVSNTASKLLKELLVNKESANLIGADISEDKRKAMETASDMILKICGNNSILINQIVPSNFEQYWNILRPLMKSEYQTDNEKTTDIQNRLFEVVVTRDNIGEAMWYIYTGLLLTSIVQLKISTRGCVSNLNTMEKNYQKFLENENKSKEKKEKAQTDYVISN
jgi:hypothetical protein